MKRKIYKNLIVSLIIALFFINNCDNNSNSTVSNPSKIKDDGSWVYILDNKLISKKDFEKTYNLFIKMAKIEALSRGIDQGKIDLESQSVQRKKDVLQRIINGELTFKKALSDPAFKGKEGNKVIETFYKQALNLYFIDKEIFSRIKKPTKENIQNFFYKHKKEFQTNGIKDINSNENFNRVKKFFTFRQIQRNMKKISEKLIGEKRINYNENVLEKYLTKKISINDNMYPLLQ